MASNSTVTVDRYVVDTLMRDLVGHDRSSSAFLIYLLVCSQQENGRVRLSHTAIAERTGLSKRACQNAVRLLRRRGLIDVSRGSATEPAEYRALLPWRRDGS